MPIQCQTARAPCTFRTAPSGQRPRKSPPPDPSTIQMEYQGPSISCRRDRFHRSEIALRLLRRSAGCSDNVPPASGTSPLPRLNPAVVPVAPPHEKPLPAQAHPWDGVALGTCRPEPLVSGSPLFPRPARCERAPPLCHSFLPRPAPRT